MASVVASSPISFAASFLKLKSFPFSPRFFPIRTLRCSLSSSEPSLEFDISFAPPKPKPSSTHGGAASQQQLYIPWIVRGDDGTLKLQSQPPATLIHALAVDATTQNPKKKDKPKKKQPQAKSSTATASASASSPPSQSVPKLSKAARRFYNENFKEPPQRLSKVLAAAGVASRRTSEELIFDGKVTVNGTVCNIPQTRVDPTRDIIYVNGNRIPKKLPPKVYFALNKPKGYICSSGEKETKSVISLFDDFLSSWDKRNPGTPKPRLFTVGRLDVATTGLIVVTNDGDFAQKLSHPSSSLPKEYITTVVGDVHKRHLMAISEGTMVEGVKCVPDSVELMPKQHDIPRARLRIVVHEGRNHEVRELVKNAGLEVHSLKRVRIGGFRLPSDLGLGNHMELKQSELKALGWKN
ncbi:putative ribosomal large subunit pseudouridine synthase SVR1 [Cardamine amara subsp. amara]|uniref:Ribosomal large subunit pseudouridine synthase SVR1 n=1 Tax=Cardamine amara subsp. amara TaxID=228776 RepID=A0ABD1AT68_CARAN